MKINVVSNWNGCGLQRDAELLSQVLQQLGHEVSFIQFNNGRGSTVGDANIFLEVVIPHFFHFGARQFLFVNPEWFPWEFVQYLENFERVFCKTADAYRIMCKLTPAHRCSKVGFFARDLLDRTVKKKRQFIHVAGKSMTKNTIPILDCWRSYKIPWELIVVAEGYHTMTAPNVRFMRRVSDEELRQLMNESWFHLMPSQYEGYGHSIHEGMGCGAVVLTTNRGPMSEIVGLPEELMVTSIHTTNHHHGTMQFVDPRTVSIAVKKAMDMPDEKLEELGARARRCFEFEKPNFIQELKRLLVG